MPGSVLLAMGGGGQQAAPQAWARSAAKGGTLQDAEQQPGAGKLLTAPGNWPCSANLPALLAIWPVPPTFAAQIRLK